MCNKYCILLKERSLKKKDDMTADKKIQKGEKTRSLIVEKSASLFLEYGFAATTTRQITDELGMTRGILYNYFKSKEEIFEAVINQYHPWLQIIPAIREADGESITEFVTNAQKLLIAGWNMNPEYTRLHLIELVEFKGEHLPAIFDQVFNKMTAILTEKLKNKKGFEHLSISIISRSLLGLFFAYLMSEQFTGIQMTEIEGSNLSRNENDYKFDYFADIYLQGLIGNINQYNDETKSIKK